MQRAHLTVPVGPGTPPRDVSVDVLRGGCIVSMATAHLAYGGLSWQILHAAVWIDGAVGFVFLAGLMVGMTQRRIITRSSLREGRRKLLRRTGLIYAGHVTICVLAGVAVAVDPVRGASYSGLSELGGPLPALGSVLALRVNPWAASILSLYVVLMVLAAAAVVLLERSAGTLVLALSLALFVAGTRWSQPFTFPVQPGVPGAVNWASWQLLFMGALTLGWYWRNAGVRRVIASGGCAGAAAVVVVVLAVLGRLATSGAPAEWKSVVGQLFSDGTLGIGRIVMAVAAALLLYRLVPVTVLRIRWLAASLATLGRRSLDCYLILSAAVVFMPSLLHYRRAGATGDLMALGVLLVCLAWCVGRDRIRRRSLLG